MKNLCSWLPIQIEQVSASARTWKLRVTVAATLFLLIGTLLIVTVQFDRVPKDARFLINNRNNEEDLSPQESGPECKTEWFPARHWTRPSSKYSNSSVATAHGQQMYGTVVAQRAIWKHQHPSVCHDKRFLVYEALGRDHGIGSVVHVLGVALQVALNLNRILVLAPQPNFEWVQGKFCEGTDTLDECYFEPLSSCTITDAMPDGQVDVTELNVETYRNSSERVLRSAIYSLGAFRLPFLIQDTPLMFHSLLERGGISSKFFYWWRAQSAAYIVRPTLRTLRELDRRRGGAVFGGQRIHPGTISVHVRHGDKWKESKLQDDATFLQKAEALIERDPGQLSQRRMFLSTEDPNTVKFFANLSNWTVQYTNVTRVGDPNVGPEDFAAKIGWDEEFLNSLLSLQLALECDGFVGAIASNWNRLIDELRSTVRCKHHRVFVDVVQGFDVSDYGW